jgi:ubiquinone/menaquinone biosynthesis C-methylase UbiE
MLDYDQLAAEYARHRRVHPMVLKELFDAGRLGPGSRVLEVGCGTGNYIHAICQAVGCRGWGIDPSEGMLARAREAEAGVAYSQGKGEKIDFLAGAFDLVFSVDVIHHVVDRRAYFAEAWRVLDQARRFCTVTDSEWIIHHRRPLTAYFPETVEVELQRYPRISDLEALLAETGFTHIEARTVEFPYVLTDLQAYRERAYSSLHLITEEAFRQGITRMEHDLARGPIPCISYYLLLWGEKKGI